MAEGDLRWKYNAGEKIQSGIVVDSNGVIYAGTLGGANAKVIAVNPNGTLKWGVTLAYNIYSGLALSNDESVLYVGDTSQYLYALYTASGNEKWKYSLGEVYSSIVVDNNDNIYFGVYSPAWGLVSLDYGGNFRWNVAGENHSGMAIGKSNTVIYYLDVSHGLREVALSNGNVNWVHQGLSWGDWGTGIQIGTDGIIYYGDSGYFYAINTDGSRKWHYALGYGGCTNNAIGSNNNIWFVDRTGNSKIIVVDTIGSEVWHYDLPGYVGSFRDTTGLGLDSNDTVFVGCSDFKLYALNQDGTLRWTYTAGDKILSGIAFSPSPHTVYFGSDDGYLYAVEKLGPPDDVDDVVITYRSPSPIETLWV